MQQQRKNIICMLLILGMIFVGVMAIPMDMRILKADGEQITINYDTNYPGGSELNSQVVVVGDAYELQVPIRSGYLFEGWYYNDVLVPTVGDSWTLTDTPILLVAQWSIISYSISYGNIEGIEGGNPNPIAYNVTDRITFQAVSKPGYIFDGWYEGVANRIEKIEPGDKIGDLVLEANWKLVTYNITYNNTWNCNNSRNPKTYNVESEVTLNGLERYGYEFLGWYMDLEDETTLVTEIRAGTIGDLVLNAKWGIKKCTISYENDEFDSRVCNFGDKLGELPEPTKEGYIFGGWYRDALFRYKVSADTEVNEDMKLYAKWTQKTNAVWYYVSGGLVLCALVGIGIYVVRTNKNKDDGYEL